MWDADRVVDDNRAGGTVTMIITCGSGSLPHSLPTQAHCVQQRRPGRFFERILNELLPRRKPMRRDPWKLYFSKQKCQGLLEVYDQELLGSRIIIIIMIWRTNV